MAHKSLISGTSYNVTGGKTLVGGTGYNIVKGRTLIGGTGYDIAFSPPAYAMLYSDGDMVFQYGSDVAEGKTLSNSYTGFEDSSYSLGSSVPWYSRRNYIANVLVKDAIEPISLAHWFNNARNLVTVNLENMSWNNVTNMSRTYYNCRNLTGSPVCGENVVNMYEAYYRCSNLTGSPVCGEKVTNMGYAYGTCSNLTGSPVCGENVTDMYGTYRNCFNLTGSPVCGNNVINMGYTYYHCHNLTGSPVCGENVTSMGELMLIVSTLQVHLYVVTM